MEAAGDIDRLQPLRLAVMPPQFLDMVGALEAKIGVQSEMEVVNEMRLKSSTTMGSGHRPYKKALEILQCVVIFVVYISVFVYLLLCMDLFLSLFIP